MKKIFLGMLILMTIAATSNAAVIPGVTATASRESATLGPVVNLVNENGFTAIAGQEAQFPWVGKHVSVRDGGGSPPTITYHWYAGYDGEGANAYIGTWVRFDLGTSVSRLDRIKVWNCNWVSVLPEYLNAGIQDMNISLYDGDDVLISNLGTHTLPQATGDTVNDFGYVIDIPDTAGVRYVVFTVESNWGNTRPRVGLSKVRFDGLFVSAGDDQTVTMSSGSAVVNLDGDSTSTNTTWIASGPAAVTFGNPNAVDTTATFTAPGTYLLTLTDNDAGIYDTMKVTVFMEPLPAGLVGYWPLDGNANDATAHNNDGILVGTPQFVPGKVGQAVKFDGASGIEIPNEWFFESLNPEMTVTFWAKIPYGVRPEGVVVGKKDFTLNTNVGEPTAEFKGRGWGLDSAAAWRDGFIILLGYGPNFRTSVGFNNWDFTYDTHNDGKWRHFALSIDASGNASYYIDGVYKGISGNFTWAYMGNDTPLSFGFSASFPGGRNWEGYLDEVRFYNVTLTLAEIQAQIAADGGTCATKVVGDINGDCEVNMYDFALLASEWLLDCTYPNCP